MVGELHKPGVFAQAHNAVEKRFVLVRPENRSVPFTFLFPLQGALGYDLVQHLLISPHNVVVEGTSDFTYLTVLSDFLKEHDQTGLDDRWSVVPVGGADLIPTFVALLGHHLNVTILIDSRREGYQKLSRLADDGYLEHQRIIAVGTLLGRPVADIEDLFSPEDYLTLYNEAFNKNVQPQDLQGNDSIVNQIARHENVDRFDHGRPEDILLRHRDQLLPQFSDDTLDRFGQLFERINATFPGGDDMTDERQEVTEEEYIQLLNEELPKQDQYEEGMTFVAYPEGAAGREIRGISMVRGLHKSGVFAQAHHAVDKRFRVRPSRK